MAIDFQRSRTRTVGRLLTLVVISTLAAFFRVLGPLPAAASGTMLLGFLLLAAFVAGELAFDLRLPRITGYLLIGILFGPHVLGLLPERTVGAFRLINETALSVIALQAGGELYIKRLRKHLLGIVSITAAQLVIIIIGTSVVVLLIPGIFPFLNGSPGRSVLAVALLFGLVAVAKSPATTIAVITELRARGPLTDTVLGVSVLKDVAILLLIAVIIPMAVVLVDPTRGFDYHQLREISIGVITALAIGCAVGWLVALYLEKVNFQPILFVLAVAFGIVELTATLGLASESYILMSIAAGFVVQNLSLQGRSFVEALEANALPIYALFFAVAGANLDLGVLPQVWAAALLLIVVRLALIHTSTHVGAAVARTGAAIRQGAWMGFIAQAGVTLGLANIIHDRFPAWGESVAAAIIAMVAVNQLIGPPLFRISIIRAGEAR